VCIHVSVCRRKWDRGDTRGAAVPKDGQVGRERTIFDGAGLREFHSLSYDLLFHVANGSLLRENGLCLERVLLHTLLLLQPQAVLQIVCQFAHDFHLSHQLATLCPAHVLRFLRAHTLRVHSTQIYRQPLTLRL
jgi:hypothetical protein